jgi:hypothetical protein
MMMMILLPSFQSPKSLLVQADQSFNSSNLAINNSNNAEKNYGQKEEEWEQQQQAAISL